MWPLVLACAVCGAGEDRAQGSYIVMTLIISVLPLAMLGGIIWWVLKNMRAQEAREAPPVTRPPDAPRPPSPVHPTP